MDTPVIDDLLVLSVTALKRHGLLNPNQRKAGELYWSRANGTRAASIGFVADTTHDVATVRLVYDCDGKTHDERVLLRWKRSNLNDNDGFYYFICPVTGRSCRKLYLYGGRFVSRFAFRALYRSQTVGPATRKGMYYQLTKFYEYEELEGQPRRKETYRGQPTPYGRKLQRYDKHAELMAAAMIQAQNGGFAPTPKETPK